MSMVVPALEILLAVQAAQAAVTGMVRNAGTGEPVVSATVAMPGLGRTSITDAAGRYVLRDVPAGPQHVSVRAIGFAPRTLHALVPRSGVLEIAVSLSPVPHRLPVVDVRPKVAVRGTTAGDSIQFPDRSMSIAAVSAHPLYSEPDVFQALGGGEIVVQPEAPSGMHIRGGAADQTAFTLDGVPVISPYHAAGMFSAWNPDALSAVSVSTVGITGVAHALSGSVAATTRPRGENQRTQGGVSNTQTRLTLDGPVGPAGYMLSVRTGPPSFGRRNEGSYIQGEALDWIAKLEIPLLGGELRALGYENDNEIASFTAVSAGDAPSGQQRNVFEWGGRSLGVEWRGNARPTAWRVAAWSAVGSADALWGDASALRLAAASKRSDAGLDVSVTRAALGGTTLGGVRLERMTTAYHVGSVSDTRRPWRLSTNEPITTLVARHTRAATTHVDLEIGLLAALATGDLHLGPNARAQWNMSGKLTTSASYARLHQFAQSLRNAESMTGSIFPADLFVGVGAAGLPAGQSDVAIAAAEFRPVPGARIGVQLFDRSARGLVLVAPREGAPFATGSFAVGASAARGVAAETAVSSARAGLLLSYGAQRVRYRHGDSSFVPAHATTHILDGGATVFPTRTSSIRVGVASGWGRRATPIAGGFEWEACNLRDRGCEFAGTPQARTDALGQSHLPPYVRVDVGARKHWHVDAGGRDVELALFGAVTNILNRRNVLAHATNPATGERVEIEMRPQAPLVVGLDWRF